MADELSGTDAEVPWEVAKAANRANWDERVSIHVDGGYDLESFRRDTSHLSQVARTDLAELRRFLPHGVAGLDVCHLQCHIGTDTVSFARAGARVVGVDFSRPALEAAAALAADSGVNAEWVHGDVLDARALVSEQLGAHRAFGLVYTSIGTIGWLADLDRWAAQIEALLRPGGLFYIRDGHPALYSLDENREELVSAYRYFNTGEAQVWDDAESYAGEGKLTSTRTYEFPHPFSELLQAVVGAGLEIVWFDEGKTLPWRFSEFMVERPDGEFELPPHQRELMPLTFTLAARRRA